MSFRCRSFHECPVAIFFAAVQLIENVRASVAGDSRRPSGGAAAPLARASACPGPWARAGNSSRSGVGRPPLPPCLQDRGELAPRRDGRAATCSGRLRSFAESSISAHPDGEERVNRAPDSLRRSRGPRRVWKFFPATRRRIGCSPRRCGRRALRRCRTTSRTTWRCRSSCYRRRRCRCRRTGWRRRRAIARCRSSRRRR